MNAQSLTDFLNLWTKANDDQRKAAIEALTGSDGLHLLTLEDARSQLRVSRATLWRMMKRGTLPFVEVVPGLRRIRKSAVQQIISTGDFAHRVAATSTKA